MSESVHVCVFACHPAHMHGAVVYKVVEVAVVVIYVVAVVYCNISSSSSSSSRSSSSSSSSSSSISSFRSRKSSSKSSGSSVIQLSVCRCGPTAMGTLFVDWCLWLGHSVIFVCS